MIARSNDAVESANNIYELYKTLHDIVQFIELLN